VTSPQVGTVYLIHFDTPYQHARHYLGWTSNLNSRLVSHANGSGSRLMSVITKAGITWQLARTWSGTRTRERQLKIQGGHSRKCPLCGVKPLLTN
jgi:predicted GIY-YIG superfamily endonuclease